METLSSLGWNVLYNFRVLFKNYFVTSVAVLTLALGIGANTAIFSVANGILLHSLPFKQPERIVFVWIENARRKIGIDKLPAPAADFLDWRNQNQVFQEMSAFYSNSFAVTGSGYPERIEGVQATGEFFSILGISAARGRTFGPDDDRPGKDHVAVLSDLFWKRHFGSDPAILGKSIILNGSKYDIIGVMPRSFDFPEGAMMPLYLQFPPSPDIWTPLSFSNDTAKDRVTFNLATLARLKPGVTLPQAQADMTRVSATIDAAYRKRAGYRAALVSMDRQLVGDVRPTLLVLVGAVGLVLLIACANVSNLLLARSVRRQKELALRSALGARRSRLIWLLVGESLQVAFFGGILALLLAEVALRLLLLIAPNSLPRIEEIGIDRSVLVFTFVAAALAGVLAGLLPAVQASRADLNCLLREETRGTSIGAAGRFSRKLLLVGELALSLLLLIGTGLLVRSFILLQRVRLGFDPAHVLTLHIDVPSYKYSDPMKLVFFNQLLPAIAALPEVEATGVVSNLPLSGANLSTTFSIEGRPADKPQDRPMANYTIASPGYFKAMGIQVLRGRAFNDQDTPTSSHVVLINQAMAKHFWPNEDPLDKSISVTVGGYAGQRRIVGIVENVRSSSLEEEPRPELYVPYAQHSDGYMFLVTRSRGEPLSLAAAIRRQVLTVDKDQPITRILSMKQVVEHSEAQRQFVVVLLSLMAGLALILAIVGTYGVVAYSVAQRTFEIGIRMALGAKRGQVTGLIIRQEMLQVLVGIALGLGAALVLTRSVASMLYEVSATDPQVFLLSPVVIALVALLAIYIPAFKAMRLDPGVVLKQN
jgi:putative ABC transport system permease protein